MRHWTTANDFVDYRFAGIGAQGPIDENVINVEGEIFFDDKYHDLVRKFIDNICPTCKPRDLYMWVETEVDDKMHFANMMARNMIRNNGIITGDLVRQSVMTFIDQDVEFSEAIEYERIGPIELYEIIHDSTITSYLRRISFEYEVELEFSLLFTVAPFRADILDIPIDPLVFKDISSTILHSYSPMHSRINVMTRNDFAKYSESAQLVAHYFPSQLDTFFLPVHTGNDKFYSEFLRDQERLYQQPYFFKKLYVSIQPIGPNVNFRLNGIFKNFTLDSVCPMMMYKNSNEVLYKVDKDAIQAVPRKMLQLWTNEPMTMAQEYIMFKVFYNEFFVTVTLYPRMVYHVKLTFKASQIKELGLIDELILPYINHVVSRIKDMTSVLMLAAGITMPNLTQDMINHHNIIDVHVTSTISTTTKLPSLSQITSRMSALPGVFFKVENHYIEEAHSVLTYRYTRSSGYSSSMDIVAYITSNYRIKTRRELVDTVVNAFQLPREQAESIYDNTVGNQDINNRMPRIFMGLTVKIWRKNSYELIINIKGNNIDKVVAQHVVSLIKAIVLSSDIPNGTVLTAKKQFLSQNDVLDFNPWDVDDANMNMVDDKYDLLDDDEDDGIEIEEDSENLTPYEESPGTLNTKNYILQRLKKADAQLFDYDTNNADNNYKSYASLCASNAKRQPIVINKEKLLEIQSKYPKAIPRYAHAGSTKDKKLKNIYICPKIWCPKSEMAMTPEQFKQDGCPDKVNDKPLILYRNGQENKSKFISFLEPSKHPKELCVPCCFFVDHGSKVSGKLRQRFAKCTNDGSGHDGHESTSNTYIKGHEFPLETGRYGRLPTTLAKYMDSSDCHARIKDVPCFVRKGIVHNSQHFIACMADVLGMNTTSNLVETVITNLRPHEYIAMNNGALMRSFVSDNHVGDEYFDDFKMWFLKQKEYIDTYHLQHVEVSLNQNNAIPNDPDVRREVVVYESMNNFINYMRADSPKDHNILTGLLCSKLKWLNPRALNTIVVEDDGLGKLYVLCQQYPLHNHNLSTPTTIILKHKTFFEPVCRVQTVDNVLKDQREFNTGEVSSIDRLIKHYQKSCNEVNASLNLNIFKQKYVAIVSNGGFKGIGILTANGVFIPTPQEFPLTIDEKVVHVMRLPYHLGSDVLVEDVVKLMHSFASLIQEDAQFYAKAIPHPNQIGVLMGDGETYVPVIANRVKEHKSYMDTYIVDEHIFLNEQITNPSFTFIEQWNMHQAVYQGYKRAVVSNILTNEDLRNEFEFLRFRLNPFPVKVRADMMKLLMRRATMSPSMLSQLETDRLAHALLAHDLTLLTDTEYIDNPSVILLTPIQVQRGELLGLLGTDKRYDAKHTTLESVVLVENGETTSQIAKLEPIRPPTLASKMKSVKMVAVADIYELFAVLSANVNKPITKQLLQEECIVATKAAIHDGNELLMSNPDLGGHSCTDDCDALEAKILSNVYRPGLFEVAFMAERIGISLFIAGMLVDGKLLKLVDGDENSAACIMFYDTVRLMFYVFTDKKTRRQLFQRNEVPFEPSFSDQQMHQ